MGGRFHHLLPGYHHVDEMPAGEEGDADYPVLPFLPCRIPPAVGRDAVTEPPPGSPAVAEAGVAGDRASTRSLRPGRTGPRRATRTAAAVKPPMPGRREKRAPTRAGGGSAHSRRDAGADECDAIGLRSSWFGGGGMTTTWGDWIRPQRVGPVQFGRAWWKSGLIRFGVAPLGSSAGCQSDACRPASAPPPRLHRLWGPAPPRLPRLSLNSTFPAHASPVTRDAACTDLTGGPPRAAKPPAPEPAQGPGKPHARAKGTRFGTRFRHAHTRRPRGLTRCDAPRRAAGSRPRRRFAFSRPAGTETRWTGEGGGGGKQDGMKRRREDPARLDLLAHSTPLSSARRRRPGIPSRARWSLDSAGLEANGRAARGRVCWCPEWLRRRGGLPVHGNEGCGRGAAARDAVRRLDPPTVRAVPRRKPASGFGSRPRPRPRLSPAQRRAEPNRAEPHDTEEGRLLPREPGVSRCAARGLGSRNLGMESRSPRIAGPRAREGGDEDTVPSSPHHTSPPEATPPAHVPIRPDQLRSTQGVQANQDPSFNVCGTWPCCFPSSTLVFDTASSDAEVVEAAYAHLGIFASTPERDVQTELPSTAHRRQVLHLACTVVPAG
ncbi:hypothetical protein JHW43_004770 [Diplocarpon mali]|nr:hypothetical protein JHW43_004770 [Diplocarpon mali]